MRLDSKLIHPSIRRATDAAVWNGGVGEDSKATAAYHTQWMSEHGAGAIVYVLTATALFAASIIGTKALGLDRPLRGIIVLVLALLFAATLVYGAVRQTRSLSHSQLEALLPVLDLTETQRAYAEAMIALQASGRPKQEVDETLAALNALLDEEARLHAALETAAGGGPADGLARLAAERTALVTKAESATDSGARDAYHQSLSLLDERIAGLRAAHLGVERIEAHLELLRQAVLATRDAARRLVAAPRVGLDFATDSLRTAVALARAQTGETERALAELRAI